MANQLTNPLGGRGTTGTVAKWSSPTTIGDSILTDSGTAISSSGPIRATGTSATAPAFTGSDTDTGIYFPAANQVRIATSGSLAIAVDASQNVGIGTASPTAPVHAFGTSTTVAATTTASAGILRIEGSATNKLFVGSFSDASFGMYAQTNNVSYPISLQPAGGNVGIGTASPIGTLEVRAANPTIICSNSSVRYGYSVWNDAASEFRTGTGGAHAFTLLTSNTERMRIDATGNVGIGTASPTHKLQVVGELGLYNAGVDAVYGDVLFMGASPYQTTFRHKIKASISATSVSSLMTFSLTSGASTFIDVMTLRGDGNVILGAATGASIQAAGTNQGLKLATTPGNTDPNTLDAYFEAPAAATAGTGWTPTLSAAGTWGGVLPVVTYARYVRVGSIVFVHVQLSGAALTVAAFGGATISMPTGIAINTYANQGVVTTNTDNGASGTGVAGAGNIYSPAFAACTRATFQFFYFTN